MNAGAAPAFAIALALVIGYLQGPVSTGGALPLPLFATLNNYLGWSITMVTLSVLALESFTSVRWASANAGHLSHRKPPGSDSRCGAMPLCPLYLATVAGPLPPPRTLLLRRIFRVQVGRDADRRNTDRGARQVPLGCGARGGRHAIPVLRARAGRCEPAGVVAGSSERTPIAIHTSNCARWPEPRRFPRAHEAPMLCPQCCVRRW